MRNRLALLAAVCLAGAAHAQTTVLDFSGAICGATGDMACTDYSQIGQNYGDRAGLLDVSHRSITTSSGDTYEPYLKYWNASYSDLIDVAWGGANQTGYISEIVFSPTAGQSVTIDGFDFGDYVNRGYGSSATILDAGTMATLWSSNGTFDPGTTATHFAPGVSSASGLILRWGPDSYDVGVDNISVTVSAVPEPATWATGLAGVLLIAGLRRRSFRLR